MYMFYLVKKMESFYIGSTSDLKQRLLEHNAGRVESTKARKPLELVYYEAGLSKEKSFKREKYFKTGFGRRFIKDRI